MGIKLYDPKTKAFVTFTTPDQDLPLAEKLLLNILIEMHVQTHYLANLSVGTAYEEPANIRTDVVSVN